ncbi:MAG TPA: membrane protein insertase YidC [Rhodanobacteraceae bacterium]
MINQTRTLLVVALFVVVYLLWQAWQKDYPAIPPPAPTPSAAISSAAVPSTANAAAVPSAASSSAVAAAVAPTTGVRVPENGHAVATPAKDLVTVTTNVLRLSIDPRGGTIVGADLLKYPQKVGPDRAPVHLLNQTSAEYYVAQDGLVGAKGSAAPDHLAAFVPAASHYTLQPGAKDVVASFTWHDPATGVEVIKRYTLTRDSYVVQLSQEIVNHGQQAWYGSAYEQLERVEPPPPKKHFLEFYNPDSWAFTGAAWYSPDSKFNTLKFGDFEKDPVHKDVTGGWVAMDQRFFLGAWIPDVKQPQQFSSIELPADGPDGKPRYLMRTLGPIMTVAPGAAGTSSARLFVGPQLQNKLGSIAPGLNLTVDYGHFTVIAVPMFKLLAFLQSLVRNWGVAIVVLVLIIQGVTWKLTEKQYVSSARMRKLQPRLKALKERFGSDKQKYQQAMMELYKKEKVNPMAGCLPLIITYPIFFALYYVLIFSVELRHAAFLWIPDLSSADPYFILPILYALTMLGSQFLTPMQGMDPTQARLMKFMPVAFAVLFFFFPAGLTLYYVVRQICMLGQQWYITRKIDRAEARAHA